MKMKRILSSLLSAAMILGTFTVPAFADEEIPEFPNEPAVETAEPTAETPVVEEIADEGIEPAADEPEEAIELAETSGNWIDDAVTTWYDNNTEASEYTISTVAELAGLAKLVNGGTNFYGKTIKLSDEITADGLDLGAKQWTPIGESFYKFCGTFDGNNKTIKNLTINLGKTDYNSQYVGLFGHVGAGVTIKNLTMDTVSITCRSSAGAIAGSGETSGVFNIENCKLTGSIQIDAGYGNAAGIAGGSKAMWRISDCNITAADDSKVSGTAMIAGIAADVENGGWVKGCQSNLDVAQTVDSNGNDSSGGICAQLNRSSIEDCTCTGDITVINTRETSTPKSTMARVGALVGYISDSVSSGGSSLKKCTYTGTISCQVGSGAPDTDTYKNLGFNFSGDWELLDVDDITINGVQFIKPQPTFMPEAEWCVDHYGEKPTMSEGLDGEGTQENPYKIKSDEDMMFFRDAINHGKEGYYNTSDEDPIYYELDADVTLVAERGDAKTGASIGAYADSGTDSTSTFGAPGTTLHPSQDAITHEFCGVLTGTVKTPADLTSPNEDQQKEIAKDGNIYHSITLIDKDNWGSFTNGLFYQNYGTIENITIKAKTHHIDNKTGKCTGAEPDDAIYQPCTITSANRGTIENCVNCANVPIKRPDGSPEAAGGLVKNNYEPGIIRNCVNYGAVGENGDSSRYYGGIVGDTSYGAIIGCVNYGEIAKNSSATAGGILGSSWYSGGDIDLIVQDCENYGTIHGGVAGGIIGLCYANDPVIEKCVNYGNVQGTDQVGGIIGGPRTGSSHTSCKAKIKYCENKGNVSGVNRVGGISGYNCHIFDCVNSGSVTGTGQNVGGISGESDQNFGEISGCVNKGEVKGTAFVGGIAGQGTKLSNNFNLGGVTSTTNSPHIGAVVGGTTDESSLHNNYYKKPEDGSLKGIGGNTVAEEKDSHDHAEPLPDDGSVKMPSVMITIQPDTSNNGTAKIYLNNILSDEIYRYMAAEITLDIKDKDGNPAEYGVTSADNMVLTELGDNKFGFNMDGKIPDITDDEILLGTITVYQYGEYTARITKDSVVQIAEEPASYEAPDNNIVVTLTGEAGLKLGEDAQIINEQPMCTLTVNVEFNNSLDGYTSSYYGGDPSLGNYNDMTVTVESAAARGSEPIELLSTGPRTAWSQTWNVTKGLNYTVTISGAGYRTFRYSLFMDENKTLTFWNNVKDSPVVVEKDSGKDGVKTTFLAGDIDNSQKIDLYDLSAAVAYFGKTDIQKIEDADEKKNYIKYDLNRDGAIDSKDIAMVLVSWNK